MNSIYTSSVARNAAAILYQLAGNLVVVYLNGGHRRRILVLYKPSPTTWAHTKLIPFEKNLLLVWDAEFGSARWLPLDQVQRVVCAGKSYQAQMPTGSPATSLAHKLQLILA